MKNIKLLQNMHIFNYSNIGEKMKKLMLIMTIVLLCSMAFAWDLIR